MIVFDLACDHGHRFEGWFASSAAFGEQQKRGLVTCPQCGSSAVDKAPMAPSVGRKGNQVVPAAAPAVPAAGGLPPSVQEALAKLAALQAQVLEKSTWVGDKFADHSRAIHYGERDAAPIHGQATIAEACELLEEGIAVAPLPFPVVPPEDAN